MTRLSPLPLVTEEAVFHPENLVESQSQQTVPTDEIISPEMPVTVASRQWRNAGRPETWRAMKQPSKIRLAWVTVATIIAFFWSIHTFINYSLLGVQWFISQLQDHFNWELPYFYSTPTRSLGVFLFIWMLISPWLLDIILGGCHHLQPLSMSRLESQYPETAQLLKEFLKKDRLMRPKLKILSTRMPIALSYGSLPYTARVVVSTGLLIRLTDQELATIYASQLGQIRQWDFPWISGMTAFVQIPYLLYWQVAQWGDFGLFRGIRFLNGIVAAGFYGLYWVLRLPILWLSRQRVYYSDRYSVELTGNPNAYSRALLKVAIGISEQVQQLGYTPRSLESLDLLLPIDPQQAISLGSLSPQMSYESVLEWECTNPYRHWFVLLHSHPLLGERLYLLTRCAQFWHLEPEFDLPERRPSLRNKAELWTKLLNCHQALPLLPRAFIFALGMGILLRCLFWLTGKVSDELQFQPLAWMHKSYPLLNAWVGWVFILAVLLLIFLISDRFPHIFACVILLKALLWFLYTHSNGQLAWLESQDPFFNAWMFVALSFSLIIWLNDYFPKQKRAFCLDDPNLSELLALPDAMPSQGQVIRIKGKLLGRRGVENWLAQDLILQTTTGLVKLKYCSSLGFVGNLFSLYPRPCQFVNQEITVLGWFRRGSSPWIDINTLTTSRGRTIKGGYQMCLTLLAIGSALWGCYQILKL